MNSKECEEQLKRLIYDWETEGLLTKINATDIEAIKHLMLENQMQHEEIKKLKQPTVFIDTQDMEERYGEQLYQDYLEEENKLLKDRITKAIEYIKKHRQVYDIDGSIEPKLDDFDILASPKKLLEILKGENNER